MRSPPLRTYTKRFLSGDQEGLSVLPPVTRSSSSSEPAWKTPMSLSFDCLFVTVTRIGPASEGSGVGLGGADDDGASEPLGDADDVGAPDDEGGAEDDT